MVSVLSPGQFDQQLYLVGLKLAAGAQRKYNFIQCTSFYCCAIWKLWHNQVFEKADKTCFSCRTPNSFPNILIQCLKKIWDWSNLKSIGEHKGLSKLFEQAPVHIFFFTNIKSV